VQIRKKKKVAKSTGVGGVLRTRKSRQITAQEKKKESGKSYDALQTIP